MTSPTFAVKDTAKTILKGNYYRCILATLIPVFLSLTVTFTASTMSVVLGNAVSYGLMAVMHILVVFSFSFKVCSWMCTYWAQFWSFCSKMNMTTVTAFPTKWRFSFESISFLKVFQDFVVAFFMSFFNTCNSAEFLS